VSGKALTTSGQLAKGLAFVLRSLSGSGQFAGWVTPDGSFTVADIPLPGRYELLLANSADSYVRSVRVSGCTYSNGVLDIAQGAHINIEVLIAQDLSKVEGVAVTGDRPTPAAMVLAIRQGSNDARVFPQDQSDSDGTFSLNAVPPGRYIVVAIDNGEDLEYANPKVIVPYLAHGQVVDVPLAAGQRVRVQVQHRM
jgi:hypothetical protein